MDTKKTMEPIDVYIMYCAMKAHFSRKDYDFFKYRGKTKISRDSFFKRKDRHFFVKISKKYREYDFIKDYFVSNFDFFYLLEFLLFWKGNLALVLFSIFFL